MKKPRRTRLSLWSLERACAPLWSAPEKHHACKTTERAQRLIEIYRKQIGKKWGRIVLHEGNLKHRSFKILEQHTAETEAAEVARKAAHAAQIGATPRLDEITQARTVFAGFREMIEAPGYFPSLRMAEADAIELAAAYDATQARLGDSRRVHRYGQHFAAA